MVYWGGGLLYVNASFFYPAGGVTFLVLHGYLSDPAPRVFAISRWFGVMRVNVVLVQIYGDG